MKSFKLLVAGAFVFALLTPVFWGRTVSAQTQDTVLQCAIPEVEFGEILVTDGCDLSIQKEVSVNGGAFVDANTSGEAVSATVGQSVVWRISVTNTSDIDAEEFFVTGTVIVGDNLPAGVTYVSSLASDGSTYDQANDVWQFTLDNSTIYPLTLTINTTATNTGLAQNIAFLSGYLCDPPSFFCEYSDSNNLNDGDEAWINVSAAPVVLAESTPVVLAATGSGVTESLVAAGLIAATLGTLGYSRFARKNS
ncbi:DUF11 domain-containing protein [Candidatus Saccharibacteria bacterium]|nr:DUF11 domain-containing protein [Candidatus Saccharibacteria bacterium]